MTYLVNKFLTEVSTQWQIVHVPECGILPLVLNQEMMTSFQLSNFSCLVSVLWVPLMTWHYQRGYRKLVRRVENQLQLSQWLSFGEAVQPTVTRDKNETFTQSWKIHRVCNGKLFVEYLTTFISEIMESAHKSLYNSRYI